MKAECVNMDVDIKDGDMGEEYGPCELDSEAFNRKNLNHRSVQ